MIARLLDALAGRVPAADAVIKTDDTLSLSISPDGDTRLTGGRSQVSHLRVARQGRIGLASSSGDETTELVGRAMASAASGEELELFLPAAAPLPAVQTRDHHAVTADAGELAGLARALAERLARNNRRVETWAERSVGMVQIANTRSVLAGYETTLAGVGAVVESIGAGWAPPCRVHASSALLPTLQDVEALVNEVDRRLDPDILAGGPSLGSHPMVCLGPRAVATFLRPLRAALTGYEALLGASPFRGRLGDQVADPSFTLLDDPLAAGRPGSRPVDDDGVVSRLIPLIDRGRLACLAADLLVGARAKVPSTGHAWRLPHASPRVGLTNLRIEPGSQSRTAMLSGIRSGVLVEDLDWGAGPNPLAGTIRLRAPWSYLVQDGAIAGRLEGVVLSGNVFDCLGRIAAIGADATWIGAQCCPSMVFEGIGVSF